MAASPESRNVGNPDVLDSGLAPEPVIGPVQAGRTRWARPGMTSVVIQMCNLYSQTKGQAAIIALTRALRDTTGNLPPLPGIFPDTQAPVVANRGGIRELCMMRWGMPSSQKAQLDAAGRRADKLRAKGKPVDFGALLRLEPDGGITNI